MSLTTARLTAAAGTTRDALNKIMDPGRGGLRTPVPPTPPGVGRVFSLDNGLEVAFIVALGRVGMVSAAARKLSYTWVERAREQQLAPFWAWNPQVDPGDDAARCQLEFYDPIPLPDLAFMLAEDLDAAFPQPAATIVVLDRNEIARRVSEATNAS